MVKEGMMSSLVVLVTLHSPCGDKVAAILVAIIKYWLKKLEVAFPLRG